MRAGIVSPLPTLARRIFVSASTSLLPTPTASAYGTGQNGSPRDSRSVYAQRGKESLDTLIRRELLPTPTVKGDWNRQCASRKSGDGLSTVAGASIRLREWMMGFPEEHTAKREKR